MMTKATLAWLGVAIVMIAAGSCFVDRKSDGLTCGAGGTCAGTRICENGYCVEQDCPGDCTACNEADKTCTVECTDSHHCGDVFCPSGWTCTITYAKRLPHEKDRTVAIEAGRVTSAESAEDLAWWERAAAR